MMKKKTLLLLLVVAVIIGFGVYNYTYQEHRNIKDTKADFGVTAKELLDEFITNSGEASQKYLNKVVIVNGKLSEKEKESLTLDTAILCYFTQLDTQGVLEGEIKIKGRCIGFDELLEVVKLDQCSILE